MKVKRLRGPHSLTFRVDEIGDGDVERTVALEDGWLQPLLTPQFRPAGEGVDVAVRARKVGDNVDLSGTVRTRLAFRCSRCDDEATLEIETGFEVLFVPRGANSVNLAGEGDGADLDGEFALEEIAGNAVDAEPAVAEALVLAMPAYPVCVQECAGLCASCGANLNTEECRCEKEPETDPRWAALEGLKKRLQ